jgi:hypothetical protein
VTPPVNRSTLPNDVEALKDIIEQQAAMIATLTGRVNQLEERYDKLARLHFGQSSEKLSTLKTPPEAPSTPTDALLT